MNDNAFEIGRRSGRAPGDQYMDSIAVKDVLAVIEDHPLDGEHGRATHKMLMEWYFQERDIQAENRMEQEVDAGCYDGRQWDEEDAEIVRSRGQMPLVYNEIAPMVDWLIGTERRTRVDWRVLPRAEDDVQSADVKTKVLKYVADINRVQFRRSQAFTEACKVGVGWLDDGARMTRPRISCIPRTSPGAMCCGIPRRPSLTCPMPATCSGGSGWTRTSP